MTNDYLSANLKERDGLNILLNGALQTDDRETLLNVYLDGKVSQIISDPLTQLS